MLTPEVLQSDDLNTEELQTWVKKEIIHVFSRFKSYEKACNFDQIRETNLVKFYKSYLKGHYRHLHQRIIIVDDVNVYSLQYTESEEGGKQAKVHVAKRFKDTFVAAVPSRGYWLSSWYGYKGIVTDAYPSSHDCISVLVSHNGATKKFGVSLSSTSFTILEL